MYSNVYFEYEITYPDLNRWSESGTQPVSVGRETQCGDDIVVIKGVQVFAIIQIPKHCLAVLATAGAQRTIRRNSHGVQITANNKQ